MSSRLKPTVVLVVLLALILGITVLPPRGYADHFPGATDWWVPQIGAMTWTPSRVQPRFLLHATYYEFAANMVWNTNFRKRGFSRTVIDPSSGTRNRTGFEFEYFLETNGLTDGYQGDFDCNIPGCVRDTNIDDPPSTKYRNFALVTKTPNLIVAGQQYKANVYAKRTGTSGTSNVSIRSIAGAYYEGCSLNAAGCVFTNYTHFYNKSRQHRFSTSSGTIYGWYNGGSYITDNTFDPCPGSWGYSGGGVDFWCSTTSNGPEPPGRTTMRPKAGRNDGYAYRTVGFSGRTDDHFTVEMAVQCLTTPCEARPSYYMSGGAFAMTRNGVFVSIPADGKYHLCRIDLDHGGGYLKAATSFSSLQARLWQKGAVGQLRIDAMSLMGAVSRKKVREGEFAQDPRACNTI